MMQFYLVVFLHINGALVNGNDLEYEGWSPTLQPSWIVCLERRDFAQRVSDAATAARGTHQTTWICTSEYVEIEPEAQPQNDNYNKELKEE